MTIKQKFRSSIIRGTGEAYLLMMEHPCLDFSSYIIGASLGRLPYIGNEKYIFGLLEMSNQKAKIRKAILNGLSTGKKDCVPLDLLFGLAALYAKQGDERAKC